MSPSLSLRNKRRSPRASPVMDASRQRELEMKRSRGEITCAECTRMKLRCDKKIPCSSCIRRGCPTICPNGSLSGGVGTRYVLASTEKLHYKLHDMSQRIRELESALEELQSVHSCEIHPLLQSEYLAIKLGVENPEVLPGSSDEEKDHSTDAKRRIHEAAAPPLRENCISNRFGQNNPFEGFTGLQNPQVGGHKEKFNAMWPFPQLDIPPAELLAETSRMLPTREKCEDSCRSYLEYLFFYTKIVIEDQIFEEVIPAVYSSMGPSLQVASHGTNTPATGNWHPDLYNLSLLLAILAIGNYLDLQLPAPNPTAERYYRLASSVLRMAVMEGITITTAQTALLLGVYLQISSSTPQDAGWCACLVTSNMCMKLGLHRDPIKWSSSEPNVDFKRHVFWQMFLFDTAASLRTACPPTFSFQFTDTRLPAYTDNTTFDSQGNMLESYWSCLNRFSKDVLHSISSRQSSITPITYSDVLDMDAKISSFKVPDHLLWNPKENDPETTLAGALQRNYIPMLRDILLLDIHRRYFAKAVLDHPLNPLVSEHAPSFMTAYQSSIAIIKSVERIFDRHPVLVARLSMLWKYALHAMVLLGSMVIHVPRSTLASMALQDLNRGIDVFDKASTYCPMQRHALPAVKALGNKAKLAYASTQGVSTNEASYASSQRQSQVHGSNHQNDVSDAAVTVFGGWTKLLSLDGTNAPCSTVSEFDSPMPSPSSDSASSFWSAEDARKETTSKSYSHSRETSTSSVMNPTTHALARPHAIQYLSSIPDLSSSPSSYTPHNTGGPTDFGTIVLGSQVGVAPPPVFSPRQRPHNSATHNPYLHHGTGGGSSPGLSTSSQGSSAASNPFDVAANSGLLMPSMVQSDVSMHLTPRHGDDTWTSSNSTENDGSWKWWFQDPTTGEDFPGVHNLDMPQFLTD